MPAPEVPAGRGTPLSRAVETGRPCTIGLVGDSLSYGMAVVGDPRRRFSERGCELTVIDAVWGRTVADGATNIEKLARDHRLPEILVVVLGTNNCDYRSMFDGVARIRAAAGPDRPIVWQNVYRAGCDEAVNRALADHLATEAARPRSGRLWVVDQHAVVAADTKVLTDLVHFTPQATIDATIALADTVSNIVVK